MRILHLTSHFNIGGITSYIVSLSGRLIGRGHHVVVASDRGGCVPQLQALGAEHWEASLHTKIEFGPQVFGATRALSRRLAQEPVDVIHAHTRVGQVVADRLSRRHRIPYVTTWHGIYRRNLGRRLWPCTGELTIAISRPVYEHLLHTFALSPDRVRLIPNGVDVARFSAAPDADVLRAFRERWHLSEEHPVVGAMGRLTSGGVKGFDLFIAAAARVRSRLPDAQFLIVGDGTRRAFLEAEAARHAMSGCVHFTGAVEDPRVALAAMDVFVFPARWPEGFGLVLAEAMAAGRPVVATRVGAIPDIVQHQQQGLLVDVDDPEALAESVVRLIQDQTLAAALGQQGRRRVQDDFNLDSMVPALESVYQQVLEPRHEH